ncbi:MAG: M48 family metalloprotease [Limnobacter sp.]|nr:M48 family metalloprotease [Limnobacter sp.]
MPLCAAQNDAISNLPSLGDAGGTDLSVLEERKLGELIMRDYRAMGEVTEDPEITAYLNELGGKIVQAAGESPANFEFFLVAESALNAFALPGGYIGVHTGLIAAARTESELASVLAHEVGHVTQRHIARMYSQSQSTSLVSTAALIAAVLVAGSNPNAAQGLVAAGAGYQLEKQLGFSRDAEREADRVGFNTLEKAGFDPQGMVDFFGRLQQNSRLYENNAPTYLRTHPLTTERMADIQNRAGLERKSVSKTEPVNLNFELVRVKSLVYADKTAQQLSSRLKSLKNPTAQLSVSNPVALAYGQALVYQKLNQPDKALSALEQARTLLGSSAAQSGTGNAQPALLQNLEMVLRIGQRVAKNGGVKEFAPARQQAELNESDARFLAVLQAYRKNNPDSMPARLNHVQGLQAMGLYAMAEAVLNDLTVVYRSNPLLFDLQARNALAQGKLGEHHLFVAQAYAARGAYLPAIEQTRIARKYAANNYYLVAEIEAKERVYKQRADEEREFAKAN